MSYKSFFILTTPFFLITFANSVNADISDAKICTEKYKPKPFLVGDTSCKWNKKELNISFLDGDPTVQEKVKFYASEWSKHIGLTLNFGKYQNADIRISFKQKGSWSYIGSCTDGISQNEPTMNYGWLTKDSSEQEFSRVVLHEFGHAIGFFHEHSHPNNNIPWNKSAVYDYYSKMGWSKNDVDYNIFNKYIGESTNFSKYDPKSIMHYSIPKELTIGGYEIPWNTTLSELDKEFSYSWYPKFPYKFEVQTKTVLHETGSNFSFEMLSNGDLMAIKKSGTGSKSTEVHILSASSNYSTFRLQTGTALHETGDNFEFSVLPNNDLMAIKKSGTGSKSTEVHILSASSNYSTFRLQTGTALHETGDNFEFSVLPNNDLMAIKKSGTGSKSTEVHILSASSNYSTFRLQTGTALHETGDNFTFITLPNDDLMAIKKFSTDSKSTEIHILSAKFNYSKFSLQTGTALHEVDSKFEFAIRGQNDLVAIKKSGTSSNTTEIHILVKKS